MGSGRRPRALMLLVVLVHSSGDGDVVEQVISQQTAELEEASLRRGSLLDEAIRQLQQQQDQQNSTGTDAAPRSGAGTQGRVEVQGPAPAPSTPRRGLVKDRHRLNVFFFTSASQLHLFPSA